MTVKIAGNTVEILGIKLDSRGFEQVLKETERRIGRKEKTFVVTPNPEFLVFACQRPWFRAILNRADLAIADGMGLVWASRLLRARQGRTSVIKERIAGIDFMEALCRLAARNNWTVYLLGGQTGVARKALKVLQARYPGLRGWAETGPEMAKGKGRMAKGEWVWKINQKQPDLLFVALGMGKQEKFIDDHWDRLEVKLAMGVGGSFDYLSGRVSRAPKWLRKMGLEWLYRLVHQPFRWRRQLALLEFMRLVWRSKTRQ